MFLGIDVGNSTMKLGLSNGDGWLHIWRADSGVCANKDKFQVYMQKLFKTSDLNPELVSRCMIASVVPAYTGPVQEAIEDITGIAPMLLDVTMETGLQIETDTPEELGADLLAGASGAYRQVNSRCIVVDFGTATTLLAIQSQGVIAGAAICAGMRITAQALADSTALLGNIPLTPPENVLGRNTVEAMQSGLVLGHILHGGGIGITHGKGNRPGKSSCYRRLG